MHTLSSSCGAWQGHLERQRAKRHPRVVPAGGAWRSSREGRRQDQRQPQGIAYEGTLCTHCLSHTEHGSAIWSGSRPSLNQESCQRGAPGGLLGEAAVGAGAQPRGHEFGERAPGAVLHHDAQVLLYQDDLPQPAALASAQRTGHPAVRASTSLQKQTHTLVGCRSSWPACVITSALAPNAGHAPVTAHLLHVDDERVRVAEAQVQDLALRMLHGRRSARDELRSAPRCCFIGLWVRLCRVLQGLSDRHDMGLHLRPVQGM